MAYEIHNCYNHDSINYKIMQQVNEKATSVMTELATWGCEGPDNPVKLLPWNDLQHGPI